MHVHVLTSTLTIAVGMMCYKNVCPTIRLSLAVPLIVSYHGLKGNGNQLGGLLGYYMIKYVLLLYFAWTDQRV